MFKKSLLLMFSLLAIITLIGCVPEEPTPEDVFFTVSFETFGGTNLNSFEVKKDSRITQEIVIPNKEGYDFNGWYKDENLTEIWYFESDKVTSDMTLYAKWELITPITTRYYIVFESDGGSVIETLTIEEGQKAIEPENPI